VDEALTNMGREFDEIQQTLKALKGKFIARDLLLV